MPTLSGAVHIKHCIDDYVCFMPFSRTFSGTFRAAGGSLEELDKIIFDYRQQHQISRPYNRAEIKFNVFENNQVLPPMQN